MLKKIRFALNYHNDFELYIRVGITETGVGGKNERPQEYKKIPNSQGRSATNKSPVLEWHKEEGN